MTLDTASLRAFYDRFGSWQDTQRFYEDAALADLTAHAAFREAKRVFEIGCGTGRFAEDLLADRLPPDATYEGVDISATMVSLARARLARFGERARVRRTDGSVEFDVPAGGFDRVVAVYVLDLLPEERIRRFLSEAGRILRPGGRLCVAALTHGTTPGSRALVAIWRWLYRADARLVGGCRPIDVTGWLDPGSWRILHRDVVVRWCVPSQVVVAEPVGG